MRITLLLLFAACSVRLFALTVNAYPREETCGYANGEVDVYVYGGTPPYTYAWADGPVTEDRTGLVPGTYAVTVTDALGATAQASATVVAINALRLSGWSVVGAQLTCAFSCQGQVTMSLVGAGGVLPYQITAGTGFLMGTEQVTYGALCPFPNTNTTTIADANGCAQTYDEPDALLQYMFPPSVQNVEPACEGGVNGNATVVFSGMTPQTCAVTGVGGPVWSGVPIQGVPVLVEDLPAGNYNATCTATVSPYCVAGVSFNVPEIAGGCNSVSGEVYHDDNSDCAHNGSDVGLANQVLTIEPGPYYTLTDAQGDYALNLPDGNYTLAQNSPGLQQVCPPQVPVPFTIGGLPVTIDLADHGTQPMNVEVQCTALEARPGQAHQVWITVRNTTYFTSGNLTVDVDFDPLVTFTSSSLGGYTLTPGHLQWITPALSSFASFTIYLAFAVPPDVGLIGTTLLTSTTVQDALTEEYLTDNSCGTSTTIQGPYDPNAKYAATSSGQSDAFYFLQQDTSTVWTIRFQNVGTAAAQDVVIVDTLSPLLDIGTLHFLDFSHTCAPSLEEGRVLKFTFAGIDLPDSTSDEAGSHGFVRFAIEPHAGLLPGMVIANTAHIFFDQNPAIVTEERTLLVTISTGVPYATVQELTIHPNPVRDRLQFTTTERIVEVTVRSADGRVVWNGPLVADGIDVDGLTAGAYLIDVRTRTGAHMHARFVKQ